MSSQSAPQRIIANVPSGMLPFSLVQQITKALKADPNAKCAAVFIARDGSQLTRMHDILSQLMPGHLIVSLPAWDCLPYDRVSPNTVVLSARLAALSTLCNPNTKGAIVLTSANALVQKLPPMDVVRGACLAAQPGEVIESQSIIDWANANGYARVPTVRDAGEYAVRGGLVDIFPASESAPIRFDFFGSTLESIRSFDPETQRTTGTITAIELAPMSEVLLNADTIRRFRQNYTKTFGGNTANDPLYAAISAGQRYPGMEHWLPLFYEQLADLTDYTGPTNYFFDDQVQPAIEGRREQILDYFEARDTAMSEEQTSGSGAPYKAVAPERLYDVKTPLYDLVGSGTAIQISPFAPAGDTIAVEDAKGQLAPSFAADREAADRNIFEATIEKFEAQAKAGRRTVLTCWSEGTRERMAQVLKDHDYENVRLVNNWHEAETLKPGVTALLVLPLETGFQTADQLVLSEQDVLGERIIRTQRKKKASDALTEATSLSEGDVVVHIDHGIGRFLGLRVLDVAGAPHDCVELEYARGDKLFLPVENIELLSRYGAEDSTAELDRLGGVAWQAKKAKLKKRIRDMAEQLIKVAAARELSQADPISIPTGAYDEFATRFAYDETEDQLAAIDSVFEDITSGKVMDRLVCGDVGFGKTEVALRAAFAMAMAGKQVALVVPTTLLSRQHFRTFTQRFAGLPIKVAQASRLVSSAELKANKQGIADGTVDIAIGTHALLSKSVEFKDLGLLIIDEEQHFGVAHKERLKELKGNVHVLTLTATPIPRTLQLALTGVRDLSLLATPPVDRLAVRSFVSPFDPLTVREALLREKYRGGQSFYVVPRVKDQPGIAAFLKEQVPEISFAIANGQMAPGALDAMMNDFYDGKFDCLVATTIVESGLDIPNANTLIVHRADHFGLAQLYQIRGRIGRSKTRAYALFTVPPDRKLTDTAQRRLEVLQSLETLGAGFQLASHDLDIRGSGNLLGDEQSGHIKEVGFELYQAMLEEAVTALRDGQDEEDTSSEWSPQISLGMPVMIPVDYVPDLPVRMQLYRRLGEITEAEDIDAFGAELIDRFGKLPEEVHALLKTILLKALCRTANIEKIDAGPKGAIISLRDNIFPNPAALVRIVSDPTEQIRLRPDQKLVFARNWPHADDRLKGAAVIISRLAKFAQNDASSATD